MWEVHRVHSLCTISLERRPAIGQVPLERYDQLIGRGYRPILATLAIPDQSGSMVEVDIRDAQPNAFHSRRKPRIQLVRLSPALRNRLASSVCGERCWQVLDSLVACSLARRLSAMRHGAKDCEIGGTLPWNNTEIFH